MALQADGECAPQGRERVKSGPATQAVLGIALLNLMSNTSVTGFVSMNTFSGNAVETSILPGKNSGNIIKKFLWSLRDMFVDEGRSFVSGKTQNILKNLEKN